MSKEKKQEKDPKEKEVEELSQTLKHVQADFENYRKRLERDQESFKKFACKDIIIKILPLLDNFQLALKNTDNKDEFVKGIEMIYAQFAQTLEELGVEKIETENKSFDPHVHEALLTDENEPKDKIVEELQSGYRMYGQVIRHAKVKIGKKE